MGVFLFRSLWYGHILSCIIHEIHTLDCWKQQDSHSSLIKSAVIQHLLP